MMEEVGFQWIFIDSDQLRQDEGVPGKGNAIRNGTEIGKRYSSFKKSDHSRLAKYTGHIGQEWKLW